MKKSLFLLGTLPIALLTATLAINSNTDSEGSYQKRTASNLAQPTNGSAGMFEYFDMLKEGMTPELYQRLKEEAAAMPHDRSTVTWNEHGPDNVGGRTRAILVDKNDVNVVYAGSVTGGLFKSINRANVWNYVPEFNENLSISSMCQTANGTILIATGHEQEGYGGTFEFGNPLGGGLFKMTSAGAFELVDGTENLGWINEIVCDTLSNTIWMATESGLRTYDVVGDVLTNKNSNVTTGSFEINALDISPEGTFLVCSKDNNSTFVSTNGGASFTEESAPGPGAINKSSVGRQEYSISDSKDANGNYYMYSSQASNTGYLRGVWMSANNGQDWTEIAPPNNQVPGSFAPFTTGSQGQGRYNNIICAAYQNPEKVFLGGLDVYSWATTGNWTQLSQWGVPVQMPQYLHADNHAIIFDQKGRMYVGSDGGVHFSDDGGQTFHQANRGYNTVQFYNIGASSHGDVMGGAQDNGCWNNYHDNSTWREFDDVLGGDGFSAEMSFINRNIVFGSSQYGFVARSGDRGTNMTTFLPDEIVNNGSCSVGSNDGGACSPFFTKFALWENPNDLNSTDSIDFVPTDDYTQNQVVSVASLTSQKTIPFTIPFDIEFDDTLYYNGALNTLDTIVTTSTMLDYNLTYVNYAFITGSHPISAGDSIDLIDIGDTIVVDSYTTETHYYANNPNRPGKIYDMGTDTVAFAISWDTLKVQDPYQSWFAYYADGDIWMTRNALRFAAPSDEWFQVVDTSALNSSVTAMDFSKDGNNLFIGTSTGKILRLSGFGNVYSPKKNDNVVTGAVEDTLIDWGAGHYATTLVDLGDDGGVVTDFGFTNDPNELMITRGGASGSSNSRVQFESTNALGMSPINPTDLGSTLPNNLPIYSCVIDRDDDQTMLIGTEVGVYVSTNGGTTWENCSGGFGSTPVMDIKQNWRTFNEGCNRPGEIYIGTWGRGIWSTEAYLSTPTEQDNLTSDKFIPNINVYPNPVNDYGTVAFNLEENADVTVQIFNLTGQLVQEIKESNMVAGANNIAFTANELPKGTYIIRLNAGDMVETSKFIKH